MNSNRHLITLFLVLPCIISGCASSSTAPNETTILTEFMNEPRVRDYDYQPNRDFMASTSSVIDGSIMVTNDETTSYRIELTNGDASPLVYGITNGNVVEIGSTNELGNYLIEQTRDGYTIIYSFLDDITVQEGDAIIQDTYFARMGRSNQTTGNDKVGLTIIDPDGYTILLTDYYQ